MTSFKGIIRDYTQICSYLLFTIFIFSYDIIIFLNKSIN